MPSNNLSKVPIEIWETIVSYLDLHDLRTLSLVCHEWRSIALPRLYHTIHPRSVSYLERLAQHMADQSALSISQYVRELVIDSALDWDAVEEESWTLPSITSIFGSILRNTTNLGLFIWNVPTVPLDEEIIELLQAYCSGIRTLSLVVPNGYHFTEPDHPMFQFKNLHHFSFWCSGSYYSDENFALSVSSLLRECPDIRTIRLVYEGRNTEDHRSQDSFSAHIQNVHLRSLTTFYTIGSAIEPDLCYVFDSAHHSSLRTFLHRHSSLKSLGFGGAQQPEDYEPISSLEIENLLPSLTVVRGPTFLCAPILSSGIANQLESVAIVDTSSYNGFEASFHVYMHSVKHMPKLKSLAIDLYYGSQANLDVVRELLKRTPQIEELCLGVSFDDLYKVIELVRLVPKIRKLSIRPASFGMMTLDSGEVGWSECLSAIAAICPNLQYVHELGPAFDETSFWSISHGEAGIEVKVAPPEESELFAICEIL